MKIGYAQRKLARNQNQRFLGRGYALLPRRLWTHRFHVPALPNGAHFWYKTPDRLWWLGKIVRTTDVRPSNAALRRYAVRFLHDPEPIELTLANDLYSIDINAPSGSWCLQWHQPQGVTRGVRRNTRHLERSTCDHYTYDYFKWLA